VAIARTILKRPAILVFDEATSSLDSRSERSVMEAIEEVSKGKTSIVIAHRLSTVVNSDRILVLEKGQIVEQGSHDELLTLGGHYSQLWAMQQKQ
jgi:ATP-binding cassette subfamily B protein